MGDTGLSEADKRLQAALQTYDNDIFGKIAGVTLGPDSRSFVLQELKDAHREIWEALGSPGKKLEDFGGTSEQEKLELAQRVEKVKKAMEDPNNLQKISSTSPTSPDSAPSTTSSTAPHPPAPGSGPSDETPVVSPTDVPRSPGSERNEEKTADLKRLEQEKDMKFALQELQKWYKENSRSPWHPDRSGDYLKILKTERKEEGGETRFLVTIEDSYDLSKLKGFHSHYKRFANDADAKKALEKYGFTVAPRKEGNNYQHLVLEYKGPSVPQKIAS